MYNSRDGKKPSKSDAQIKNYLKLPKFHFADYLLRSDRYEEALKAYKSAGRFDISMKMTKDMAKNCIEE